METENLISAQSARNKAAQLLYNDLSEEDKKTIDIINNRILDAIVASKNYVDLLYSDKELKWGKYFSNNWKGVFNKLGYNFERIKILDGDGGRWGDETIEIGLKIYW